jgi:hypothetical protein
MKTNSNDICEGFLASNLDQLSDLVLPVPLFAVVQEVGLEAEVGLRHRPVDRSFHERKIGPGSATDFKNLGQILKIFSPEKIWRF